MAKFKRKRFPVDNKRMEGQLKRFVRKEKDFLEEAKEAEETVSPADSVPNITSEDLTLLLKELAERKLIDFVKQAWHVLEPDTPFVDGWHLHAICDHLEAVVNGQITRLLINIPPRHMKLLSDDTLVITPKGYVRHGDLKVGDYVFNPSGKKTKIIKVSEKGIADYEIEFTNKEKIHCNGDHLWTVYDRLAQKWKTVNTEYMYWEITKKSHYNATCRGNHHRFKVPDCKTLKFSAKKLPLHPYFLGCWLGDGSSSKVCITHAKADYEHIEKLKMLGYKVSSVCKQVSPKTVTTYFGHNGVLDNLRRLKVLNNKHIPEMYQACNEEQRLELLAGLIDTDGCVGQESGNVRISTVDKEFAEQILRLVNCLGFKGGINRLKVPPYGKYISSHKWCYQVQFQPTKAIPTVIKRKKIIRIDPPQRKRGIKKIKKLKIPKIGNCITVDAKDGLYVIGRKNIVTHNSLAVSVFFPCWWWIKQSNKRMLFSSYSSDLSQRDGDKCIALIKSPWYQANWSDRYSLIKETSFKIENSSRGYRIATSVGGMTTGEGGDVLITDDPHNAKEIESELKRLAVLRWWDEAMSTRLNDQKTGAKIIVMQRLHEKDLSGHVLSKDNSYVHLCLPARYELGDERTRTVLAFKDPRTKEGEVLWDNKFADAELTNLERDLGEYAKAGQLQQRPSPRGGGLFKTANLIRSSFCNLQEVHRAVRYWDKAGTDEGGCFTCGVLMFQMRDKSFFIYDVVSGQWNSSKREKHIEQTVRKDSYLARRNKFSYSCFVEQEPGSSGKESAEATIRRLAGLRVYADKVTGSKTSRATDFAVQIEANNVYVLDTGWTDVYFERMEFYPMGEYKDWGDASGGAFNKLIRSKIAGSWGRNKTNTIIEKGQRNEKVECTT